MKRRLAQAIIALAAVATLGGSTPAIALAEEAGGETASESSSESSEESSSVSVEAGKGQTVTHTGNVDTVSSSEGGSATVDGNVGDAYSEGEGSSTTVNGDADTVSSSEGGSATVNGNVGSAYSEGEGSSTTVNGDADTVSSSEGGSATVNGNVGSALSEGEGSSTIVNGDAGLVSMYDGTEGGNVTVSGDVGGPVWADYGTVNVGGNVDRAYVGGSTVTINGDVRHGLDAYGGSTVFIGGNVNSTDRYYDPIYIAGTLGSTAIIKVNGTVSSDDEDQAPIVVWGRVSDIDDDETVVISEEDLLKSLDITLWKINPNKDGNYVAVPTGFDHDENHTLIYTYTDTVSEKLSDAVEASIKYIIKVDNSELSSSSETGKAGDSITIKVKEGYTVSTISGGTATLTKNADGTYSLVVPAGGGVEVSAVLKAIKDLPSNNQNTAEVPLKKTAGNTTRATKTSSVSTSKTSSTKAAQTGWKDSGESRYYYNEDGTMQTGWAEIDGNKYYFDEDGIMQTGWVEIEDKWYYFDEDGVMQTGWLTLDDKTYYLGEDGALVTGEQTIDGENYEFDDDGVLLSDKAE